MHCKEGRKALGMLSGFMQKSWAWRKSRFWEETGKRGFQLEEMVETEEADCADLEGSNRCSTHCKEDSCFW